MIAVGSAAAPALTGLKQFFPHDPPNAVAANPPIVGRSLQLIGQPAAAFSWTSRWLSSALWL
jgi:hypothetical protein